MIDDYTLGALGALGALGDRRERSHVLFVVVVAHYFFIGVVFIVDT